METIDVSRSSGVVTVTLNRPAKKNAANGEMWNELLETFRDMVSGMIDIYLSGLSYKMNEIMKVLTILSTVFLPITFIAGV